MIYTDQFCHPPMAYYKIGDPNVHTYFETTNTFQTLNNTTHTPHTCTYLIHTSPDLHIHENIDHYESSSHPSVKTSPSAYPYILYLYIKQYIPNQKLVQICIYPWTSCGRFRPAGGILFKSPKPQCTYCRLHTFCTHTRSLHSPYILNIRTLKYALYIYIVILDDSANM